MIVKDEFGISQDVPYGKIVYPDGGVVDVMTKCGHLNYEELGDALQNGYIFTVDAHTYYRPSGNEVSFFGIRLEPERTSEQALRHLRRLVRDSPATNYEWGRLTMDRIGHPVGDTKKDALDFISGLISGKIEIDSKFHTDAMLVSDVD